ncbi:MAG: toxic anion resistance protein [Lachnospiraceae bacterium]|nr:toxic anion resistance protein [Lachnospiraceae bacterium]MBP3295027.1 toxic anion resistance protein [Lachnospiraceae bacterium]MCR5129319.1 toxic anion resistance protein [Lachnospiraceae bacterium]
MADTGVTEALQGESTTPSLTLNPFGTAEAPKPEEIQLTTGKQEVADAKEVMEQQLTPEEMKMVDDFAAQIDITDSGTIMTYGAATQQKMADFSNRALDNVRTKDMGEVGELLTGVVAELKGFNGEEEKGIKGFFKKQANKVEMMKAKYDRTEVNINKIVGALQEHETRLMKDAATLDKMYDMNLTYYKELSMYIIAGKKKLEEAENKILPELRAKAQQTGLAEDAQAAKDYQDMCDRFSKKLTDLELTRTIAMQTAPQIRMIQSNDIMMVDKIRSTVVNTIPLWKSQMVIALGIHNATEAAKAQRAVTDVTNQMLLKNAEALKIATIETEKESQRGIVDLETLNKTNQNLISTFDEVMKIQAEGREKRKQAEQEMARMETELKNKLMEVRDRKY